jgi:hypothetical protein
VMAFLFFLAGSQINREFKQPTSADSKLGPA